MITRWLLGIALVGLAHAAQAEDRPLPLNPDRPGVWRVATYYNRTTQFSCSDRQPRRPICGVELAVACEIRQGHDDTCDRVRFDKRLKETPYGKGSSSGIIRYRIEKVRLLTQTDVDRSRRTAGNPANYQVGDVLVTIRGVHCTGVCLPRAKSVKDAYRLRKVDGRWLQMWYDTRDVGYE